MAADSEKIEIICPEIENLTEVSTNINCPMDGCSKVLPNTSALRMHLVKTHKTNAEGNVFERGIICQHRDKKIVFCCPVDTCVRGKNTGRYFHRLAHVKQHYMNVHGEKKFACKKCEKKFGRNDVCLRHEKTCGMIFPCSCGVEFNSRTSMLTHARRNGHIVPLSGINERNAKDLKQADRKVPGSVANQAVCISFVPVHNKGGSTAVRPLIPKKIFSDVETQTEQPCCQSNKGLSLTQNYNTSSLIQKESLSTHNDSSLTQNDKSCSVNESTMLTQNNECSADEGSLLMQSDKGVMVNMQSEIPDLDALCKYTQTAEYLQAEFDEHFDVDFTIDNEDFKELTNSQTQTNWGLAFGNLFEDNETQTLESYLELDPSTIDCATQTKAILDDIFSVDTETQTLLPVLNFDEEFGAINCGNCMDGQTQTLPWTTFADSETMPLSILQGSSIDGQTQTLPWSDFGGSVTLDILQGSTGTSMDGQTQTLPWTNFSAFGTMTLDILQGSASNVETQTAFNVQLSDSENVKEV